MTHTALEQAAEALRQAHQWISDWAPDAAYEPGENHTHLLAVTERINAALAALTAEAASVSPDREALARHTARKIAATYYDVAEPSKSMGGRLTAIAEVEIAAANRLPAQAEVEVEAMAMRLEAVASLVWEAGREWPSVTIREAAALLRRLSSPVGEWRPIEPRNLDGTNWKHRCCQVADAARQEGFDYALSLQFSSPAAGEWRPIESAPDDGQYILVWSNSRQRVEIRSADGEYWRREKVGPTHWMPLPPAPPREKPT